MSFFIFACEENPIDDGGKKPPVIIPECHPATGKIAAMGLRDGVTRIGNDSLAFVIFAPKKQTIHLIGDFNNWQSTDEYIMEADSCRFWIKIGSLDVNKYYAYQYLINKSNTPIRIADPYSSLILDPNNDTYIASDIYPNIPAYPTGKTTGIVSAISTQQESYNWKIQNFTAPKPEKLNIYELLIRDFTVQRSIKAAKEKLPYLKNLGINAVELMPFNEFEGNDSWGYNPSFYFAPDKAYGTSNDYKAFIDECHANGMAVIMDIVLNHSYGQSPLVRMYMENGKPSAENPWYNTKSNFANPDAQWGHDFNHESPHTQAFVDSVCAYWMKEYKIDGYRFDFTKGFSNTPYPTNSWGSSYDAARIKNLKRIYDGVKKRNPNVIFICEHLSENREEKELADYGMMLWSNMNYNANEMTMGWVENNKSNLSWASYKQRGWQKSHLVAYMESHDEERLMFKNLEWGNDTQKPTYNVKDLTTALQRNAAAAVVFFSIPGPKMIWQFGELGYDVSIDFNGRLGKKPIRWEYYEQPERRALYDVYAEMFNLRINHPVFSTTDFTLDVDAAFKTVTLKSPSTTVVAMANFDVTTQTKNVNFSKAGTWKEHFSGNEISTSATPETIILNPGEYRLYFNRN